MPTAVLVYRLSFYFSLCVTVSSLYLPDMNLESTVRRSRSDPHIQDLNLQPSYRTYRSTDSERPVWNKRTPVYSLFKTKMSRHASRHRNDLAFVDRMFNLFDLDHDRVIERREFKAVLQILGIVSHNI